MDSQIETMIHIKKELEKIPYEDQSIEYRGIVEQVSNYLKKNCPHKLVDDSIDIDLDRSQTICYCEICYTCFDK